MPTSYTSLLGLALPVTGELSGTWGDTVNDYITQYVDAAVAGAQTISGSQTAVTLSTTNGTALSQAGSGSTGSAQYQIINCTGNPASALTVTVPSASKVYLVLNNTSTSQTVTVKGAATTGVTVAAARAALIAWNGTDFELVATDDISKLNGVLGTANGGTGLSSFTANGVLYASSSSALATGSSFVFNGTNVGIGTSSPGSKLMVAGSFSKSTSDESTWGVRVQDETAMAAGVGGGLVFTGNYTSGGAKAAFASISGTKVNGTTSNGLGQLNFYTTNSSSVLVQNMVLDSSGNLGLGVTPSAWGTIKALEFSYGSFSADSTVGTEVVGNGYYNGTNWIYRATGAAFRYNQATAGHTWYNAASGTAGNTITWAQELQITAAGFTQPVAYADTVSALGNTGTATTINLQNANVFTATLTGNCTFTLSNPIATGSSSFTLILTNDGTAGRTVAWAGGSFVFPGGAASLSRTTTANAVDVWVFFTPNGGTTWYGNIAMKNMIA